MKRRRKTDTSILPLKAQNALSELDRLTSPLDPPKRKVNPIGTIGMYQLFLLLSLFSSERLQKV